MPHQSPRDLSEATWPSKFVYAMGLICLILGLSVGYLVRGFASRPVASTADPPMPPVVSVGAAQMPSLEQMKHMADKQAQPLLEQLKNDPSNKELLAHIAYTYKAAHQFKKAASYFERELQLDPNNVPLHTEMASCLYYAGEVDDALGQLRLSLKSDPKDANSLFNLGVILWKGKHDAKGAIAVWENLLEANPSLQRRPVVEHMIAEARQQGKAE